MPEAAQPMIQASLGVWPTSVLSWPMSQEPRLGLARNLWSPSLTSVHDKDNRVLVSMLLILRHAPRRRTTLRSSCCTKDTCLWCFVPLRGPRLKVYKEESYEPLVYVHSNLLSLYWSAFACVSHCEPPLESLAWDHLSPISSRARGAGITTYN